MHQLDLKLPTADRYLHSEDEAPRAFSRGVVFLAFSGLGWLAVWLVVKVLFALGGGH